MYCVKCGKEIGDNSEFCPYCGAENPDAKKQRDQAADYYKHMYERENSPENYHHPQTKSEGMVIPLLALIFGLLGGWLGLLFGIIGLAKYKEKSNKIMCIVGIVAWVIWLVIYIYMRNFG